MTTVTEDIVGRFVRVDVFRDGDGDRLGYAWGLGANGDDYNLIVLYTRSKAVRDEIVSTGVIELYESEVETAVDVDAVWTPGTAYAALARYQLTGVNPFVKEG